MANHQGRLHVHKQKRTFPSYPVGPRQLFACFTSLFSLSSSKPSVSGQTGLSCHPFAITTASHISSTISPFPLLQSLRETFHPAPNSNACHISVQSNHSLSEERFCKSTKIIVCFSEGWKWLDGLSSGKGIVGKGQEFRENVSYHSRVSRRWPMRSVVLVLW
jgi:hypothetical protein